MIHPTALFWDIDGTLLTTARAGLYAWEVAVRQILEREPDGIETVPMAGITDKHIARSVLKHYGVPENEDLARNLLQVYDEHLPASLHRKQGRALPGVNDILTALKGRQDVFSVLLTGNTRIGGRAKLAHYGLNGYFPEGVFAEDGDDRASLARACLELTQKRFDGAMSLERIFVIGDTPHDISCGKSIGVRTVAVASGTYPLAELAKHGPWWAIESLPPPAEFMKKLGIA